MIFTLQSVLRLLSLGVHIVHTTAAAVVYFGTAAKVIFHLFSCQILSFVCRRLEKETQEEGTTQRRTQLLR